MLGYIARFQVFHSDSFCHTVATITTLPPVHSHVGEAFPMQPVPKNFQEQEHLHGTWTAPQRHQVLCLPNLQRQVSRQGGTGQTHAHHSYSHQDVSVHHLWQDWSTHGQHAHTHKESQAWLDCGTNKCVYSTDFTIVLWMLWRRKKRSFLPC